MLPVKCEGPGGSFSGGTAARQHGSAPALRAWPAGHLILVAGREAGPAPAVTVSTLPQLAVAAAIRL